MVGINRKMFDVVGTIASLNAILQMQGRYGLTLPKIKYAKVKTGLIHRKSTLGKVLRGIAVGGDEISTPQKDFGTTVNIPFVRLLQSIAKSVPTAPINSCKFSRDNQITLWTGALWGDTFVASVVRAVDRALIVADMPFGTYQGNSKEALSSRTRLSSYAGDNIAQCRTAKAHQTVA